MNVNYSDKSQDEEYDPLLWNSADANEVRDAINSKVDSVSGKSLSTNDYTTTEKNKLASLNPETTTSIKMKLGASTALTDGYLASEDFNIFNGKADRVSGTVPVNQLPPVYFSGMTGTGTQVDPYIVSGSGGGFSESQLVAWFQSRPNFAPDRILQGDLTWIDPPTGGELEKLATPALGFGTPQGDSVVIKWTGVTNATAYTVQRASDNSFADAISIYSGALFTYTDAGLTPVTTYYYRLRATASGFAGSNYANGQITTAVAGNTTPPTPTAPVTDDTANTFDWTYSTGYNSNADYEYTINGGTGYSQVTAKPISIGEVALAIGKVGVRVKASTGRNVSGTLFNTVAFTLAAITPSAPTAGVVDDTANTFDFTYSTGYTNVTDYEYSLDGGTTVIALTAKPLVVGDVAKAIGQIRVRVKAASGRNASAWLQNATAYTASAATTVPLTSWKTPVQNGTLTSNSFSFTTPSGQGFGGAKGNYYIPAGGTGWVEFTADAALNGAITLHEGADTLGDRNSVGAGVASPLALDYANSRFQTWVAGNDNFANPRPAFGANTKGRIRLDGTSAFFECSSDAGVTWQLMRTTTQPQVDLYVKAWCNINLTNCPVNNIRGFNLTLVS